MVTVIVFNVIVITLAVLIHYEFLYRITSWLPHMRVRQRFRIVLIVLIALTAHAVEVWLFAVAFFVMHHADGWGHLQGNFGGELLDCVYFSFTTYTTLGMGDIEPIGNLRKASFPEIWNSPEARELRASIARKDCYCTNEVFLWPSIVFQPDELAKAWTGSKAWKRVTPLEPEERIDL